MRKYTKRRKPIFDSCRSFFVYNDGRLFVQSLNFDIDRIPSLVSINMSGALIVGRCVERKGTGLILSDWSIKSKEFEYMKEMTSKEAAKLFKLRYGGELT